VIPVIRKLPDGSNRLEQVQRPKDVQILADRFLHLGGRYMAAVMSASEVKMVAALPAQDADDIVIVAEETAANGPGLVIAFDRLVRETNRRLEAVS
jgi:hypothetical protein